MADEVYYTSMFYYHITLSLLRLILFQFGFQIDQLRTSRKYACLLVIAAIIFALDDAALRMHEAWSAIFRTLTIVGGPVYSKIYEGLLSYSTRGILRKLESLERDVQLMLYLDFVGEPDFALWSAGARIVQELTSRTYTPDAPFWTKLWRPPVTLAQPPELALTPGLQPGCCWPMKGQHGSLGIKLAQEIVPRAITIDHLPGQLSYRNDTAPRLIDVWGALPASGSQSVGGLQVATGLKLAYEDGLPDLHPDFYYRNFVLLGHIAYDIYGKLPVQTFDLFSDVGTLKLILDTVLLIIKDNWGNQVFTCIYRVRVHGDNSYSDA